MKVIEKSLLHGKCSAKNKINFIDGLRQNEHTFIAKDLLIPLRHKVNIVFNIMRRLVCKTN